MKRTVKLDPFYHLRTQLGKMKGNASEIPDFVVILNE